MSAEEPDFSLWFAHIGYYHRITGEEGILYLSGGRDMPEPGESFYEIDDDGNFRIIDGDGDLLYVADVGHGEPEYMPRIKEPGNFTQYMFAPGAMSGESEAAAGNMVLVNVDNFLDDWRDYSFDGRYSLIFKGTRGQKLSEMETVLYARNEIVEFAFAQNEPSRVRLIFADLWGDLLDPLQTNYYAGTNAGPVGFEGTPDDILGLEKPLGFGYIPHGKAVMVNSSTLTLQLHDGPMKSVIRLWDGGVEKFIDTAIGTSGDFATPALLVAATIASGKFATCLAYGLVRMANDPVGAITAEFEGDFTDGIFASSFATIIERIARTRYGFVDADFDLDSFADLEAARDWVIGIHITEETTLADVINALKESYNAYAVFDELGRLTVGIFGDFEADSERDITQREILDMQILPIEDTVYGIPPHRFTVEYLPNFAVLPEGELGGAATQDFRNFVTQEFRKTDPLEFPGVKTAFKGSQPMIRRSYLKEIGDAETLRNELSNIYFYDPPRQRFQVTIPYDGNIKINQLVTLYHEFYGLTSGRKCRIVGRTMVGQDNKTIADMIG